MLAPGVRVVFCGINPGSSERLRRRRVRESAQRLLASAARVGLHPARARAREQFELLRYGVGAHERGERGRRAARATSGPRTSQARASGSRDRERLWLRARSASSARPPTAASSASGRSTGCRRGGSATRRSSSFPPRRPRTPPCPGASACAGSPSCTSSSRERATSPSGGASRSARPGRPRPPRALRLSARSRVGDARWRDRTGRDGRAARCGESSPRRSVSRSSSSAPWCGTGRTSSSCPARYDGQHERCYLVRTGRFEPAPRFSWEELREEGMTERALVVARTSSSRASGSSRLGSSRRSFVTSSTAGLRARRSTRTRSSAR